MARTSSRPDPGADDRRRRARAAQQAAAARARRRRTTTQVAIVGGVAVLVVAIVATAVVLGSRRQTPAAGGGPSFTGTTTVDGAGVPFAIGGSGGTASGVRVGADDAKVKIDLWVDYSCPHCQEFEATNDAALTGLVAKGNVSVTYHNIQIVTDYGTAAGSASACLAVNDPKAWPAFNAALYANHSAQTDGWSAGDFASFAASNGAGEATQRCISGSTYAGWITANTAASARAGVDGTPTMFIDGQKQADVLSGSALTERVGSLVDA